MNVVASQGEPDLFEVLGAGERAEVDPVPRCEFAFVAPVPARGVSGKELVSVAVGVVATVGGGGRSVASSNRSPYRAALANDAPVSSM
jgi:hypothetical protein